MEQAWGGGSATVKTRISAFMQDNKPQFRSQIQPAFFGSGLIPLALKHQTKLEFSQTRVNTLSITNLFIVTFEHIISYSYSCM